MCFANVGRAEVSPRYNWPFVRSCYRENKLDCLDWCAGSCGPPGICCVGKTPRKASLGAECAGFIGWTSTVPLGDPGLIPVSTDGEGRRILLSLKTRLRLATIELLSCFYKPCRTVAKVKNHYDVI